MKKSLLAGVALTFAMSSAAYADILIGTAGPMTGQYASFGAQMKAGAEQAVEDINAAGGVNGEMQRKAVPSTYTASGNRSNAGARYAAPLSVSRSL